MRILVIPDVHLKPWMYKKAKHICTSGEYDRVIMLGDIADDWNQELNIDLYISTFDAAIDFVKAFPDTVWCYGNHDVSYVWQRRESGYSAFARGTVVRKIDQLKSELKPENAVFIYRIDNVLFSHAGLMEEFVKRFMTTESKDDIDTILWRINRMTDAELWNDYSPIWARPQIDNIIPFPENMFQVVGHTPVKETLLSNNILTVDNFSTYRDGSPIGNEKFICIDTKNWAYEEI